MTKSLARKIERILDESYGQQTLSLVMQLGHPEDLAASLQQAASEELQRDVVTRPEALLPPLISKQKSQVVLPYTAAQASSDFTSSIKPLSLLKSESMDLLTEVCASHTITQSRLACRMGNHYIRPEPLWLARALSIKLDREDLRNIVQDLKVTAIFLNRTIQPPPQRYSTAVLPEMQQYATHSWGIEKTGALACWGAFRARGNGVKVAVLDTGIQKTHPDLTSRLLNFAEFDSNGHKVAEGISAALDDHGHGSHVCGIIAGGCASGRWIGMAPKAQLLVARILGKKGGTDAQVLSGMQWAVEQGAAIINLSLGTLSFEPDVLDTYATAIFNARAHGIPVVTAMGNHGNQTSGAPANDYFALAVGATDIQDRVAAFSAGRTQIVTQSSLFKETYLPFIYSKPELTAPGVDIYSADLGDDQWKYSSGTSMAAPHVTGSLALLLSAVNSAEKQFSSVLHSVQGTERVRILQALLMGSVEPLGEVGQDHRFGWGRLDILRAYNNAVKLGYLPGPIEEKIFL
jgi:Subtilase family